MLTALIRKSWPFFGFTHRVSPLPSTTIRLFWRTGPCFVVWKLAVGQQFKIFKFAKRWAGTRFPWFSMRPNGETAYLFQSFHWAWENWLNGTRYRFFPWSAACHFNTKIAHYACQPVLPLPPKPWRNRLARHLVRSCDWWIPQWPPFHHSQWLHGWVEVRC